MSIILEREMQSTKTINNFLSRNDLDFLFDLHLFIISQGKEDEWILGSEVFTEQKNPYSKFLITKNRPLNLSEQLDRIIKKCLREIDSPSPVIWNCWFMDLPAGARIAPHTDHMGHESHLIKLNVLIEQAKGGHFIIDGNVITLDAGDALVFRPDLFRHEVTETLGSRKSYFSVEVIGAGKYN